MCIDKLFGPGLSFGIDGFSALYISVSIFAWLMCLLFAPRYMSHDGHKKRFYVFSVITLIATVGVFASRDLFTLFMFFEMMSLASYVWVAQDEKEKSLRAGDTYMAVAVIGGLVLLMGIILLYTNIGTVRLDEIKAASEGGGKYGRGRLYAAALCLFFGFSAKAGAFPIHIWLPKAHPVAPAPASALLSGVLTKTGIFGIMIVSYSIFPGDALWGSFVMGIGLITMVVGALLALFSVDIKRTLACSSVSQIGFIIVGIAASVLLGVESEMAKTGTLLHMVNHTLVKLTVFLVAGTIYQNIHSLNLNEIRGFGRKKPVLGLSFLLGGLSLSGFPGFLGYISKTGIHEAIVETDSALRSAMVAKSVEWIFLFSGGCTLCYMTKLFVCVFCENNRDANRQKLFSETSDYATVLQKATLCIPAILTLGLGITLLAKNDFSFLSFHMMKGSLVSISIGIVLYFVMVRLLLMDKNYLDMWPKWFDLEDKVYRPILLTVLPTALGFVTRILDDFVDSSVKFLRRTVYRDISIQEERFEGTVFTRFFGHLADVIKAKLTGTELTYDIEHRMALKHLENEETESMAKRSLSYGLIVACMGMFVMLGFILYLVYLK